MRNDKICRGAKPPSVRKLRSLISSQKGLNSARWIGFVIGEIIRY